MEEEQPCCCSVFKHNLYSIASSIKNILAAISILALVKNLLSLIIFLYDVASKFQSTFLRIRNALKIRVIKVCYFNIFIFKGDVIVGKEQIDKGEFWWGFWIVMFMFAPNLVFITWFIIANRRKLKTKDTWFKVFIAGNVQLVTLIK